MAKNSTGVALYQRKYALDLIKDHANTRPEISYVIGKLSQFLEAPTILHLKAAHKILKYIKGAPTKRLFFLVKSDLSVTRFTDSDWASCPNSRRSTLAYCFYIGGVNVSWKSKKQTIVAASSTEAEYRAMTSITKKAVWIRKIWLDLDMPLTNPISLYCDS
ncbi:secreted RxLR effector protein 161-like [Arachis hypogaea]|uniref:secreted RxLR effector protein 161-like n=1 Tax=Arachis hypogaea TaxID=3818 RepID=UPI000DEC4853|nr:uncharacterized protein LOC112709644 [Arachis hypogaea]